ncbi:MAG: TonB-dependent receptor [Candidatus Kapabacteria bacterium]|nr:TonB-dependent receptor [Ignavibacteriota bacterium]MCW5884921.1 TonB-dependent receptor [Candidatus Kapabacteria bacterium]
MKRYHFIYIFVFIMANYSAFSNNISGTVVCSGQSGRPIPGATIRVENTVIGTYADKNGNFTLKNMHKDYNTLLITAVGYKPQVVNTKEISLDSNIKFTVFLEKTDISSPGVVVTATRSEKLYEDVPVKISVLTDKIFEATVSMNLRDGLSFQPGLRIETNCQNCGFSEIRMNGLEGKYSQVLIDGKPIYSSLNGVYGLEQIPSNMIDRVEVIRGGGSALYGGNSIAGVVNIITKTPSDNFLNASGFYSTIEGTAPDATVQLNGAIVNSEGNMGVYLFGMNRNRAEWDANNDGFTEVGRLDVSNLGGSFFYKPDHKSRLNVQYHAIFHEIRGGNNLDLLPHEADITEMTKHTTNMLQVQYERYLGNGGNKLSVYASGQMTNRESYYGAEQDPNAYGTTDNSTIAGGVQYSHLIEKFAGNHVITAGYELNSDKMIDLAPAYNRTIDQHVISHGLYLQDDWGISEKVYFVFGSRIDNHNLIDGIIFSPRANFMYKPNDKLSLRTSYSTGFRAPQAFDEDLHITQVGGEGMVIRLAEDLEPEYSQSISFSADYNLKLFGTNISISNEYFYTNLQNVFILEDAGRNENGDLLIERRNGEAAMVYGSTLELMTTVTDNLSLKGGLTLQRSLYAQPVEWAVSEEGESAYSDYIMRTPDFYGFFTAQYALTENLNFDLSGVYTGPMWVPHFAGGIGIDGNERPENELKRSDSFIEINSMISYKLPKLGNLELQIGVQNMLNSFQNDFDSGIGRDAGYIYGPSRPRTFLVGLKTSIR